MSRTLQPGRFFGRIAKTCEVNGFILSESRYSPGTRISRHAHLHAYLCFLLRGSYRETCGSQERFCGPRTVLFHPAGEAHSDWFLDAGGTIFRFEICDRRLQDTSTTAAWMDRPFETNGGPLAWLITRLYSEFHRMDSFSPLVLEGLVLEILGQIGRQQSYDAGRPAWMKRVAEFLNESSPEALTVSRIAEVGGVHPGHLSRIFRHIYGCSVGEFIRALRIEYAQRELRSSEGTLAEIAVAAGYSDQSHFCRSFKIATGATPAEYRSLFHS